MKNNLQEIFRVIIVITIIFGLFTFTQPTYAATTNLTMNSFLTYWWGISPPPPAYRPQGTQPPAQTIAVLNSDDNATSYWGFTQYYWGSTVCQSPMYSSCSLNPFTQEYSTIDDVNIYGVGYVGGVPVGSNCSLGISAGGSVHNQIPGSTWTRIGLPLGGGYTHTTLNALTPTMELGWSDQEVWSGFSYLVVKVDYTPPILPITTTSTATNPLYISSAHQIQLNGAITYTGGTSVAGYNCSERGFVYGTSSVPVNPGNVAPPATYAMNVTTTGTYAAGAFFANVTGLVEGSTYYYRAYSKNGVGYAYGDQVSFTSLQSITTTGSASNIGYSGSHIATLSGTLAPTGITWTERGFGYGTVSQSTPTNTTPPNPYTLNTTSTGSYTNGVYSANLTSLLEGATYYFRGYAKDTSGYWWSSTQNSWTAFSHPNITTVDATEVGSTSAKLQAAITWDGGQSCDVRFGYDTSSHPTVATYATQTGWVEDVYPISSTSQQYIYGLTPSTTYYFRAVARNDVPGDKDSANELTFTTPTGISPPGSFVASSTATTATLSWIRGAGSTTTMIRYKTSVGYPTSIIDGTFLIDTTASSATLTGLLPGTSCYFMGWGESGGTYSTTNSTAFTTTSAGVVTNTTSSNLTAPSNWYRNSTATGFGSNPFGSVINDTAVAYEMPETTVWILVSLLLSMAAGIWIYSFSSNLLLALLTVGAGIGFSAAMGLLPMWILFAYIIFGLTIVVISTRYGG